ncbi:MAG: nitrite reductase, copper-containing, partial [Halobacteriales archaeon]|nr:nitrite reductase, copper-containing [Halobacteriales archaeon]
MTYTTTRRRVLQTAGLGGTAALAGCVVGSGPANDIRTRPLDLSPDTKPAELDPAKSVDIDRIAADPRNIPAPITRDTPETVEVELETLEQVAEVEP